MVLVSLYLLLKKITIVTFLDQNASQWLYNDVNEWSAKETFLQSKLSCKSDKDAERKVLAVAVAEDELAEVK